MLILAGVHGSSARGACEWVFPGVLAGARLEAPGWAWQAWCPGPQGQHPLLTPAEAGAGCLRCCPSGAGSVAAPLSLSPLGGAASSDLPAVGACSALGTGVASTGPELVPELLANVFSVSVTVVTPWASRRRCQSCQEAGRAPRAASGGLGGGEPTAGGGERSAQRDSLA